VRVYQFRHIRVRRRRYRRAVARARLPVADPVVCPEHGGEAVGPAGRPGANARAGFASLGASFPRAAIVQGTRTPPSHGGNPGSNPGSGIASWQVGPGLPGPFAFQPYNRSRWGSSTGPYAARRARAARARCASAGGFAALRPATKLVFAPKLDIFWIMDSVGMVRARVGAGAVGSTPVESTEGYSNQREEVGDAPRLKGLDP
jgi:hypothetical protein